MKKRVGCVWVVAALLAVGLSAGAGWIAIHARIAIGGALLVLAGGAGIFLMGAGIIERGSRRERARNTEEYRRWLVWENGKPDPGAAQYDDWYQGGAARYEQDLARYIRTAGKEPGTGANDGQ